MIETEAQRRWWFATHPVLSGGRKGEITGKHLHGKGESDKASPEAVDEYVERALEHETDEVVIELLKRTRFWFGTEFDSKPPEEKHALLWGDEDSDGSERKPASRSGDGDSGAGKDDDDRPPTFGEAVLKGMDSTLQAWRRWLGVGASRLPPKGTRERSRIEAARKRGVRRKKAEELENIRSGGRGSGIWTEKELQEIRRTGEFPNDAEWHHDPTVANRPDLADNPRVVHPVRGGRKGHLDEHGGDWRNPRE